MPSLTGTATFDGIIVDFDRVLIERDGDIVAVGIRHGAILGPGDHAGLLPRAEYLVQRAVGAVAQCGPGDPGLGESGLGGHVDLRRSVRIARDGGLLARVEDPLGAGVDGDLDGLAMQADQVGRRVVA